MHVLCEGKKSNAVVTVPPLLPLTFPVAPSQLFFLSTWTPPLSSPPHSLPTPFPSLPLFLLSPPLLSSQQPLWHKLIKDYQDMSLLVEGPLTNLRRSDMHLSKPAKLINKFNPVRRRMCTHTRSHMHAHTHTRTHMPARAHTHTHYCAIVKDLFFYIDLPFVLHPQSSLSPLPPPSPPLCCGVVGSQLHVAVHGQCQGGHDVHSLLRLLHTFWSNGRVHR